MDKIIWCKTLFVVRFNFSNYNLSNFGKALYIVESSFAFEVFENNGVCLVI